MKYSEIEKIAHEKYPFAYNDELKDAWIEGYSTRDKEFTEPVFTLSQVKILLRKLVLDKDPIGIELIDKLMKLDEELSM
jgi:hypothetical protein